MRDKFIALELIILGVSVSLAVASFYIFQNDSCGQPESYDVGLRLYCREAGFPIKILSGGPEPLVGFGGNVLWVDKSIAYIGNSIFYILTLNLGYLMLNGAKKLFNK